MDGPLKGTRIVEWSAWLQGPMAGMMLGDLGADVIKIEDLKGGDPSRGLMTIGGASTGTFSRNFFFAANNRNKRSLALDLKEPRAVQVARRLIERSDVFLHNFRESAAEKLGLGYEAARRWNPRIIYAVGSGYGPLGPDADRPSLDPTIHARSGVMDFFAPKGQPPHYVQGGMADQMAGVMLAYGVLAALAARQRTGVGQRIDCSLLGSMLWLQATPVNFRLLLGREHPKFSRDSSPNPLYNYYQCADGAWIFIALAQADRFWESLCRALSIEHIARDPKFKDAAQRRQNKFELIDILTRTFQTKPYAYWDSLFRAIPSFIYEKVQSFNDVIRDQQVLENQYIVPMTDPEWGEVQTLGCPVRFTQTNPGIERPAPELGQHSGDILTEFGYSPDEVADLYAGQVVA